MIPRGCGLAAPAFPDVDSSARTDIDRECWAAKVANQQGASCGVSRSGNESICRLNVLQEIRQVGWLALRDAERFGAPGVPALPVRSDLQRKLPADAILPVSLRVHMAESDGLALE